jgi:outer membrane protein assembly factor BamB/lysophospholipase L1-like esterase
MFTAIGERVMKLTAIARRTVALAGVLLLDANALALAPAGKCESGKLKTAGSYYSCRLGANVRAVTTDGTPALRKCDAKFSAKWGRAEKQGSGRCLSSSDRAALQAFTIECTDGVATALAGGPPPTCSGTHAGTEPPALDVRAERGRSSRCESRKMRAAGEYYSCRLNVNATAVKTGSGTLDFSGCDAEFSAKWERAERKGQDQCPSSGDQRAVQTFVIQCTDGVATALAGGPLPTCPLSDEWPFFNHDPRNSRANPAEKSISPDNVGQLAPRWRVDGLSGVTGTPAVVDGVVYFGDWSGVFHAVRTTDGTELWRRPLGSALRPSPLVAGDRVYIPESNGKLHALSRATGDIVWTATLDTQPFLSIDSSPVLADNTIVIGVESFEQAIGRPDYTFRGNVVGLDADTGQERWRVYMSENDATSGAGASVWSSAAVDHARKLVFIGTGQAYEQPAGPRTDSLIAIRYETGEVAWVHQFTPGDVFTVAGGGPGADADVGAAPNLFSIGGRDVVGVGQKNGFYHVLDRETGDVVWEVELTTGSPLGGVMVTAAVHDGAIYVNSNKWRVFGIFSGMQSPLDTSSTFALDARDGTVLWETPMPAPMFGAMTVANGVVYHGTIDGTVHALSAADGTRLWSDKPGGDIAGGFSIVGGTLYVGRGFWFFAPPATPNGGLVAYTLPPHWVGTWSTSPLCFQAATLLGLPASTRFDDQSVRMIVRTSVGGDAVRVKLTNGCGSTPLEIGAATVGVRDTGPRIRPDTDRTLRFAGQPSVTIPAGSTVTSDAVELALPALSDLAITLYLPTMTLPGTSHPQAATGYLSGTGDFTADLDGAAFRTIVRQWFFLDAVEVLGANAGGAIVALGDSIIDGTGSTYDANTRWPDFLARRLVAAGKPIGVLNQGINGNKVLNSLLGDSALVRFDRDVLGQAGAKYVILLEGINDIGLGNPDVTADQIIAGYRELIDRAHAAGLKIFGGTLTPAEGNPYPFYAAYDESKRVAVNQFIRESGAFDSVVDFAAAVSDPANAARWRAGLSVDSLHPSDAGAAVLGDAVDLSLFE